MSPPAPDPWLLPEDGITDDIAIEIASRGVRPVRLTMRERQLATIWMLLHNGTRPAIVRNLSLPNEYAATALIQHARASFETAA